MRDLHPQFKAPKARAKAQALTPIQQMPKTVALLTIAAMFAVMMAWGNMAHARGAPDGFADLAERLLPSVVNIKAVQTAAASAEGHGNGGGMGEDFQNPFPPSSPFNDLFEQFRNRGGEPQQQRPRQAAGSGFVIDADGIIVTNNHVIADANEVYVIFNGETKEYRAKVLGRDEGADLAVLKIDVDHPLTAVPFGDSDVARIGDWVVAIGNPWGLGGTVTAGIISARGRDIDRASFVDYIQTDAPINQGNSGGPLFNLDGEVVGINTAIYSRNGGSIGLGFSIPSNQAKKIVKQLREGGKVRRGWLGVSIQPVTPEIAEGMGLDEAKGALVSSVFDGSPASDAGVIDGDVIIEFNKQDVPDATSLRRVVASTDVGIDATVVVVRRGKKMTLNIVLGERDEAQLASISQAPAATEKKEASQERLGMLLAPLTVENRKEFNIPEDLEGIVIANVRNDSDAAAKQLRPGIVIVADATGAVKSLGDLDGKIELARKDGRKSILLHVWEPEGMRFVPLKIDEE